MNDVPATLTDNVGFTFGTPFTIRISANGLANAFPSPPLPTSRWVSR